MTMKKMTRIDHAKWMAEKGIAVFIVQPNSKRPLEGQSWYLRQTTEPKTIEQLFDTTPECNYGLHLGEDYVVIDLDNKIGANGVVAFEKLCAENDVWSLEQFDTLTVKTPGGGYHLYFHAPFACANKNFFPDGIDVRGVVGYVVGPGSQDGRGSWEVVEEDADIQPLPEWLHEYIVEPGYKDPNYDIPLIELDQDESIRHAIEWLQDRAPAIEGQNGDDWTYETLQYLRDFGLSQTKAAEVINDSSWNARCEPPWGDAELEAKIENAFAYGQNRPGCKSPIYKAQQFKMARPEGGWGAYLTSAQVAEMFHPSRGNLALVVDNDPEVPNDNESARRRSFKPRSEAEQDAAPEIEWLLERTLQRESLVLFYGPENSFKSFLVLDMVLCAAANRPWASYGGKDGAGGYEPAGPLTVVYLAGEGSHGIERKRRPAWREGHDMKDPLPFYTVNEMPIFSEPEEVELLISDIHEAEIEPDIIVVDTAARAMVGLDENSAKDTGIFVAACDHLKREFRCCVVVVHHSGKDDKKGSRGSTNLPASFDARFRVKADTDSLVATIKNEKQKDGDPWERPVTFKGEDTNKPSLYSSKRP